MISKYSEVYNKQNNFIDFLKKNNVVCISTNSLILNIYNYLNNFISKFFKKPKFFKNQSNNTYLYIYFIFNLTILLKNVRY